MESEDDFFLPTWAYEHTVYEKKTKRETVLSYEEDETQLPEDLEIIATEELVRRKSVDRFVENRIEEVENGVFGEIEKLKDQINEEENSSKVTDLQRLEKRLGRVFEDIYEKDNPSRRPESDNRSYVSFRSNRVLLDGEPIDNWYAEKLMLTAHRFEVGFTKFIIGLIRSEKLKEEVEDK